MGRFKKLPLMMNYIVSMTCRCAYSPELLFSSACFSLSLQLSKNFLEGSDVALLLLRKYQGILLCCVCVCQHKATDIKSFQSLVRLVYK